MTAPVESESLGGHRGDCAGNRALQGASMPAIPEAVYSIRGIPGQGRPGSRERHGGLGTLELVDAGHDGSQAPHAEASVCAFMVARWELFREG